ncbi:uncharacterized protein LOC123375920 isoform X3 [Mauremys mutica]|uniref:uncharacterized protein LOC123375920 isoform X3 n=1 Tax=Mauremys mutica TaxID=74926 RepID=UPI001D144856|nr:uncharacterized protein LOC123375920 isoform X3 [Mauremys mutica]
MVAPGCSGRLQGIKGRLLPRPLCEIVGGWLGELLQPRSPGCVRCHPLPGTGVEQTKQAKVTTAVQSTAACEGERRLGAEHHHRLQELSPGGGAGRLFALESTEKATASSMDTTSGGNNVSALSNDKIFVLTRVYLAALSLSLVGSSSVLAVATLRRRCFHSQLRPLFLLSLADFLAALVLIITAAIQLLPAQLFILAYEFCPYGLMLAMMFYAISFLMVIVYAYEVNRTIRGWRVTHEPAPQERSRCMERAQHCLPYVLACCLILIHRSQDVCYKYVGGKDTGLEMKILFFMYLLLVLSCSTFLYCRVKRWCRRNNEVRLLNMENDGFASRNIQSVCKISRCFQLVFLICWTPGAQEQDRPMFPLPAAGCLASTWKGLHIRSEAACVQKHCFPAQPPLLHQHRAHLHLCTACCHGPDHVPPRAPAQFGLWLAAAELPPGGSGGDAPLEILPRPQSLLR